MTVEVFARFSPYLNRRVLAGWLYLGVTGIGGAAVVAAAGRYLPSEQAGFWFTLQSLAAFALLGDLGLSVTGVRQMAHSYAATMDERGRWIAVSGMVETRPGLAGVSDVLAVLRYMRRYAFPLCALIGAIVSVILLYNASMSPALRTWVLLAWLMMIGATLAQLDGSRYQAALEGIGRVDIERTVLSATYFLTFMGIMAVMFATRNIAVMSFVWLCGMLASRWALGATFKHVVGPLPAPSKEVGVKGGAMLRVSAAVWLVTVGAAATRYSQAPAINMFLGAAALPGFYLAYKVLNTVGTSLGVIVQADRALFTQELAAGRPAGAYSRVKRCSILLGVGSVAMSVGFVAVGRWFVTSWLKNPNAIDDVTVWILAIDSGLATFTGMFGQFVLATGRNPFVLSVVLSGVVNVILLCCMLPIMGIRGAAVASLGAGLLTSYWYNLYEGMKMIRALRANPTR